MAKKRRKDPPAGAPEWMVTYGDMVTLLLTFFVLLLTFMKPKEPEQIIQVLEMLKEEFGSLGGMMQMPTEPDTQNTNKILLAMTNQPKENSPTDVESIPNRDPTVTTIRDGRRFTKGGKIPFGELSAALQDGHTGRIEHYANALRGHRTQIEVRGHANRRPVAGSDFIDHFDLSYKRARAVAEVLIAAGVEPERVIIVGAGTTRPVTDNAYTVDERLQNDIVEILELDTTVDDYQRDPVGY